MFGRRAKKMTEASNHYLDWSRTGELLLSGSHRYSRDEIVARGFIVASIAAFAYLGATYNDEEKTHCSSLAMSIIAGLFGFVASHAIVLIPLFEKRREMSRECRELRGGIQNSVSSLAYRKNVMAVVDYIMQRSLSTDQHANASLTWGTRKTLLSSIKNLLDQGVTNAEYWQNTPEEITERLESPQLRMCLNAR